MNDDLRPAPRMVSIFAAPHMLEPLARAYRALNAQFVVPRFRTHHWWERVPYGLGWWWRVPLNWFYNWRSKWSKKKSA